MLLWGKYIALIQMCVSARCELFVANVIRWTWRRGKGTLDHPTRMRGGPLWKGGCMCIFVCAMTCVMFCLLSPPLLPSSLLSSPSPPLVFSSSLSLPPPSSPSSLPLLPPLSSLLSPPSLPSPTICLNTAGYFGHDVLCCTQWWSFCPTHMKMASNLVSVLV